MTGIMKGHHLKMYFHVFPIENGDFRIQVGEILFHLARMVKPWGTECPPEKGPWTINERLAFQSHHFLADMLCFHGMSIYKFLYIWTYNLTTTLPKKTQLHRH